LWSNTPIIAPVANVIANPIPNVTSRGVILMILSFNDINPWDKNEYLRILLEKNLFVK
jgi:hypothetical protein